MGQFFPSLANIGALSESAGTVTLADSHLRIGGQGFQTGSLDLALGALASGTRYQIYSVVSAGSAILVKSTNENSVGPAGYTSWKLVGSFYSDDDGTPAFGSFVTIEGKPSSEWVAFDFTIGASTTPPTEGVDSVKEAYWRQDGDSVEIHSTYYHVTAGGGGSGSYQWPMPLGLTIDTTKTYIGGQPGRGSLGQASARSGTPSYTGDVNADTTAVLSLTVLNSTNHLDTIGSGYVPMSGANCRYTFDALVPIVEWSNTPIKDL